MRVITDVVTLFYTFKLNFDKCCHLEFVSAYIYFNDRYSHVLVFTGLKEIFCFEAHFNFKFNQEIPISNIFLIIFLLKIDFSETINRDIPDK